MAWYAESLSNNSTTHSHKLKAAGLQYYHTAKIVLQLAEPAPLVNALERINRISAFEESANHHATLVCALAISSNSASVWVNSFGPITFCKPLIQIDKYLACLTQTGGRWIKDPESKKEVIGMMTNWSRRTGWPVHTIVDLLKS